MYALQLGCTAELRAQESDEEKADVLPSLAQRGKFNGHAIYQTTEEGLDEAPVVDGVLQGQVRGGDDANVDLLLSNGIQRLDERSWSTRSRCDCTS